VSLISRIGILKRDVTRDDSRGSRRFLPDRVKVAGLIDRHRWKISSGLGGRAQVRHEHVGAVRAARVAHVRDRRPERDREAAPDQDLIQGGVIMDNKDMLYRS